MFVVAPLDLVLLVFSFGTFGELGISAGSVTTLLLCGTMLFLLVVAALTYWAVHVWMQCKRGELGFRLQARVVLAFTSVSMIPAVLVSGCSYLFFEYGVRAWFDNSIKPAFEKCSAVALDHSRDCSTVALGSDMARFVKYVGSDLTDYTYDRMSYGADIFNFSSVYLFKNNSVRTSRTDGVYGELDAEVSARLPLLPGGVEVLINGATMYAVQLLDAKSGTYVVATRDNQEHIHGGDSDEKIIHYGESLRSQVAALNIQFAIAFLFLFLVILFIVIWLGVGFSKGIVGRLSNLFLATQRVRDGDFDFKIEDKDTQMGEEIATVISAFNQMVERLSEQRLQLESAYKEINNRKVFVETVLSGVSSGVMALSPTKHVTLMNERAMELLSCNELNKPIEDVFPEVLELVNGAKCKGDLTIIRKQEALILSVNIEWLKAQGLIITFDDISGLVEAQRKAAWSDVARRIAHEIKNPITPIYLAAERLSSKYAEQITSEKETFLRYTDTIIKHVSNISGIVDEFAQFARMPSPVFKMCDILSIIREISFLGQFGNSIVCYDLHFPDGEVPMLLDREQISQVFVNIFKNACESINASPNQENGRIDVTVTLDDTDGVKVEVRDNGIGFSEELIGKLTEPYVTTRDQGTGLGLAIVKKILEEHNATISFYNAHEGGVVLVTFKRECMC